MHLKYLPTSAASRLGKTYVKQFYKYLARSPYEKIFVIGEYDIHAVAVLSLSPHTLSKRLIWGSYLWLWAPIVPFKIPLFKSKRPEALKKFDHTPELLFIMVDAKHQKKGLGKELLKQIETFLKKRECYEYVARTSDADFNPAREFYKKSGFEQKEKFQQFGTDFILFHKNFTP